jgi:hypothetical protein
MAAARRNGAQLDPETAVELGVPFMRIRREA